MNLPPMESVLCLNSPFLFVGDRFIGKMIFGQFIIFIFFNSKSTCKQRELRLFSREPKVFAKLYNQCDQKKIAKCL